MLLLFRMNPLKFIGRKKCGKLQHAKCSAHNFPRFNEHNKAYLFDVLFSTSLSCLWGMGIGLQNCFPAGQKSVTGVSRWNTHEGSEVVSPEKHGRSFSFPGNFISELYKKVTLLHPLLAFSSWSQPWIEWVCADLSGQFPILPPLKPLESNHIMENPDLWQQGRFLKRQLCPDFYLWECGDPNYCTFSGTLGLVNH